MAFYKDASTYNPLFNQAAAASARGNQYTVAAAEAFKPGDILNQYVTNRREQEKVDAQLKQQEFANKLAQDRVDIATRAEQRTVDKDAAAKKALTGLYGVAADPGQDVYDRQGMFKMNDYLAEKFKDTAPTAEQMADIETAFAQGDIDPKFNTDRYRGKLLKTGAEGGMDPSILKSAVDVLAPKGSGKMTDYEKAMLNYNLGVSRDAKKLAAKDVYDKQNKTGSYKDKYGKGFNIEEASYKGLTGKDAEDTEHLAKFWASEAGKAVKKLPKDTQKSLMARWEADYAGESSTLDLTDWVPLVGGSAAGDVLSQVDTKALNKMLEIQQANKPTATTGATATQVAKQQGLLGGKASGQDTLGWLKGRFGDGSKVGGTAVTPTGNQEVSSSFTLDDGTTITRDKNVPLTVQWNNPGAIKQASRTDSSVKWQGEIGRDAEGHIIFDTPENGARAQARNLATQIGKGTSLTDMIKTYATGNQKQYIARVAKDLGIQPGDSLTKDMVLPLMRSMSAHEAGKPSFSDKVLLEGYKRSIGKDTKTATSDDAVLKGFGGPDDKFLRDAINSQNNSGLSNEERKAYADSLFPEEVGSSTGADVVVPIAPNVSQSDDTIFKQEGIKPGYQILGEGVLGLGKDIKKTLSHAYDKIGSGDRKDVNAAAVALANNAAAGMIEIAGSPYTATKMVTDWLLTGKPQGSAFTRQANVARETAVQALDKAGIKNPSDQQLAIVVSELLVPGNLITGATGKGTKAIKQVITNLLKAPKKPTSVPDQLLLGRTPETIVPTYGKIKEPLLNTNPGITILR